jgi:hypothetical protein
MSNQTHGFTATELERILAIRAAVKKQTSCQHEGHEDKTWIVSDDWGMQAFEVCDRCCEAKTAWYMHGRIL